VSLEWVGEAVFWQAWDWLKRFDDQPFSFTDCTSFAVMKNLRIVEAATNDAHFRVAGYFPLLTVPDP
jgi:predicted nucleic acid-binding protein